jgi:hypothetical protein
LDAAFESELDFWEGSDHGVRFFFAIHRCFSLTPPASSNSVNLGGWLVMEPFITPSYYQKYPTAVDEWTLSVAMAADTASGGLQQLEDHYNTFIVSANFHLFLAICRLSCP